MFKHNCGNEIIVAGILAELLPHARLSCIDGRQHTVYDECLALPDGVYVIQDMPIPLDWSYGENKTDFDAEKQLHEVLMFARQRFGDNSREPEIRSNLYRFVKNPFLRELDFVILEIKAHRVVKKATLEVASEDHFVGEQALAKTISDCLKHNGAHTQTAIIDARRPLLYTLERQVRNAISAFL